MFCSPCLLHSWQLCYDDLCLVVIFFGIPPHNGSKYLSLDNMRPSAQMFLLCMGMFLLRKFSTPNHWTIGVPDLLGIFSKCFSQLSFHIHIFVLHASAGVQGFAPCICIHAGWRSEIFLFSTISFIFSLIIYFHQPVYNVL